MQKGFRKMFLGVMLLAAGFMVSGSVFGQGTDPDELWQKGINYIAAHRTWVPGKVFSHDEEKDGKGKVTKVTESWIRCFLNDKGRLDTEIVKVIENSKDITAQAKKEMEKAKKNEPQNGSKEFDPFSPESLRKVTYQAKDRGVKNNRACQAFDFRQKVDEKQYQKGTIWLDEETGAPMEIIYIPDPLPQGIKHLRTTIRYGFAKDGTWYAETMTAEGDGAFLGMKMAFSSVATLSDYWQCPESALTK